MPIARGFVRPFAFVVQWIEQIRPKDKMGVRFPPRAHKSKYPKRLGYFDYCPRVRQLLGVREESKTAAICAQQGTSRPASFLVIYIPPAFRRVARSPLWADH